MVKIKKLDKKVLGLFNGGFSRTLVVGGHSFLIFF